MKERKGLGRWVRVLLVFAFTTAAWVFFRAENLSQAIHVFTHAFASITSPVQYLIEGLTTLQLTKVTILELTLMLGALLLFDFFSLKQDVIQRISSMKPVLRWAIYVVFLLGMLYLLPTNPSGQFIYFQF